MPAAVPALIAPVAAAPAGKARAVNGGAFGVFEHAVLAVAGAHKNAQRLATAAVRVHAKGVVGQRNGAVFACQVAQAAGHVHMVFLGAVHRLQDAELAIVAAIALAAAVPTVSAAPAGELAAIDHRVFAVIEGARLASGVAGINAQCFHAAPVRVGAKGVVVHQKGLVAAGQLAHALGHVHIALARSVAGAQDLVGPVVTATLRGRRGQQPEEQQQRGPEAVKRVAKWHGEPPWVLESPRSTRLFCEDGWQKQASAPL